MIYKKLSRKTGNFQQLYDYICQPIASKPLYFTDNLSSVERGAVVSEFENNSQFLKTRKNGVLLYHEILSFHKDDRAHLCPGVLTEIAQRFIQLRTDHKGLVFGAYHSSLKNPHLHFMISSNEIHSNRKLRLSNQQFKRLKIDLNQFLEQRYPKLTPLLFKDLESVPNTANFSQKQSLCELILEEMNQSHTLHEFSRLMLVHGFKLYLRGKTFGFQNLETKKKVRLKTLGIEKEFQTFIKQSERYRRREERGSSPTNQRVLRSPPLSMEIGA